MADPTYFNPPSVFDLGQQNKPVSPEETHAGSFADPTPIPWSSSIMDFKNPYEEQNLSQDLQGLNMAKPSPVSVTGAYADLTGQTLENYLGGYSLQEIDQALSQPVRIDVGRPVSWTDASGFHTSSDVLDVSKMQGGGGYWDPAGAYKGFYGMDAYGKMHYGF
jgi:hypothetical protein